MTRQKGYRKKPLSALTRAAAQRAFHRSPKFFETMDSGPARYNQMMDEIDRLEAEGRLFVLRPSEPVTVSRTEKNVEKLETLFHLGRADTKAHLTALHGYLSH